MNLIKRKEKRNFLTSQVKSNIFKENRNVTILAFTFFISGAKSSRSNLVKHSVNVGIFYLEFHTVKVK